MPSPTGGEGGDEEGGGGGDDTAELVSAAVMDCFEETPVSHKFLFAC